MRHKARTQLASLMVSMLSLCGLDQEWCVHLLLGAVAPESIRVLHITSRLVCPRLLDQSTPKSTVCRKRPVCNLLDTVGLCFKANPVPVLCTLSDSTIVSGSSASGIFL